MATAHQVQAAIQEAVAGALASLAPVPMVAIGWPSIQMLQANVTPGMGGLVAIYDKGGTKNSTRWNPLTLSVTVVPATITSTLGQTQLTPGQTTLLTINGTPSNGDAVSCIAQSFGYPFTTVGGPSISTGEFAEVLWTDGGAPLTLGPGRAAAVPPFAQVAIAGVGTTAAALATMLASQINSDPNMSQALMAIALGHTVRLTAVTPVALQSYTGNGGTSLVEVGRRCRQIQIVLWAQTELQRQALGDPIETLIADYEIAQTWLALGDGTIARISYETDYYLEDATLYDTYRRDFHVSADYPITTLDALYAVVAPVLQLTGN